MLKVLFAVLIGLVGAALLHIVIILSLPNFTGRDAYTRVMRQGPANRFIALEARPDETGLSNDDPFLRVAVCHFDVSEAPVRLFAPGNGVFWSLAVYDSGSNEVFSMTDRTSIDGGGLDLLIASAQQVARIRRSPVPALAQSIMVEMKGGATGYAVLRAMVPQPSFEAAARELLDVADCLPLPAATP